MPKCKIDPVLVSANFPVCFRQRFQTRLFQIIETIIGDPAWKRFHIRRINCEKQAQTVFIDNLALDVSNLMTKYLISKATEWVSAEQARRAAHKAKLMNLR